jgi:ribose transport system ATP-binding protein
MTENAFLSIKNITKNYPGVTALNNVSIDFAPGEVHALVGENGAGKSTLIKVVSGAITPDSGTIVYGGREFKKMNPSEARDLGIEIVYQEFNLAPSLSVAENIFLGNLKTTNGLFDKKRTKEAAQKIINSLGVEIDVSSKIKNISTAYMQLVEIAKAISREAKVLIMDEPSASLTENEVETLLNLVRKLKKQNMTIIYVSHRMDEIFQVCDKITVMRDGVKIETLDVKDTNRAALINLMVGRELNETYPIKENSIGDTVLEAKGISGNGVHDISFSVRSGEILGFAGLVGSGRTETAELLFGAEKMTGGSICINNQECKIRNPRDAKNYGIGLIPEDRKNLGVVLNKAIDWNITLTILQRISQWGILNKKQENRIAKDYSENLKVKTPSLRQKLKLLSGGNQQKVVLAKWMATDLKVIIFDEPTRGIDVNAKHEIYKLINEQVKKGMAVIMISSDMEELLGMSDRLIVFSEGGLSGELKKEEFSQAKILEYASGK